MAGIEQGKGGGENNKKGEIYIARWRRFQGH
jgi:hypothetical protein